MHRLLSLFVALMPCAAMAAAVAWTPVPLLRQIAEAAVLQGRPGSTVRAHIDANVRLASCGALPQAMVQGNGQTPSVRLSCQGPQPWTLYVPVEVRQAQGIVVLTQPVAAGQAITPQMVQLQQRNVATLAGGYFTDTGMAVGAIATRALGAGTVLSMSNVRAAPVIRRGQTVTLQYRSAALTVRAAGLALGDAAPGQVLRVENLGSHRIVTGVVDADGRVIIGAGA